MACRGAVQFAVVVVAWASASLIVHPVKQSDNSGSGLVKPASFEYGCERRACLVLKGELRVNDTDAYPSGV